MFLKKEHSFYIQQQNIKKSITTFPLEGLLKHTNMKLALLSPENLHHSRKEVTLSPEQPEFQARTGRVATMNY